MVINAQTDTVAERRPWGTGTAGTLARGVASVAGRIAMEVLVDTARRAAFHATRPI